MSTQRAIMSGLLLKATRERATRIGRALRIPVVFLKGAWAEPVLWRGESERPVADVDVLVPHDAFDAYLEEAVRDGWKLEPLPGRRFSARFIRERVLRSEKRAAFELDVHRDLVDPLCFPLDPRPFIARAQYYDSIDGPVLSLCPTDQVVYTAASYADDVFRGDDRKLRDLERLLAHYPIDWGVAVRRARRGNALPALARVLRHVSGTPDLPELDRTRGPKRLADHLTEPLADTLVTRRYGSTFRAGLANCAARSLLARSPAAAARFVTFYGAARLIDRALGE